MIKCRVCANITNNRLYSFVERYLGLGDSFDYIRCSKCNSLSIVDLPGNLEKYYPSTYYSYRIITYNRIMSYFKKHRDRYLLGKKSILGFLLSHYFDAPPYIEWLVQLGIPSGASILEVGSGAGALVVNLHDAGFRAEGIDPFLSKSLFYPNGTKVTKQTMREINGSYDCIMMHHCIEHIPDPHQVFHDLARLSKANTKILIRTPVADTFGWKTYKENWFQLDAPRHCVIYSETGFCGLASTYGFDVEKIIYDSTENLFWASEQYSSNISMLDENSYYVNSKIKKISAKKIENYRAMAMELNRVNNGDQAAYYLVKK